MPINIATKLDSDQVLKIAGKGTKIIVYPNLRRS